jgi:hypothetical protein
MNPQQNTRSFVKPALAFGLSFFALFANAQMITGTWQGKIGGQKVELKIIQKGDSLTGTAYYYTTSSSYRRYSIKGYFGEENNVVWWDDQLLENKGGPSKNALLSVADFNCPGGGVMKLDGKASTKNDRHPNGSVTLAKVPGSTFSDEWDFVIDNYTIGANDPDIIDSVALIARTPVVTTPVVFEERPPARQPAPEVVAIQPPRQEPVITKPETIEEKFVIRKKVFTTEVPLTADSIELRFFDNVQIDGDSITLFLNEKMIFTHVRLEAKPFIIKLAVKDLNDTNELTMVAENLGTIPPNTAYLVAIVGDKRYDINLSSTEETSGMIRLTKPKADSN